MGFHNSHTDIFISLYTSLLRDMAQQWLYDDQWQRDLETIVSRTAKEGFSFLSKTLPALGKTIDDSLKTGKLTTSHAFKTKPGTRYPAFLQVLFERVYDANGDLKDSPSVAAIADLRQICFLSYKYEVQYEANTTARILDQFIQTDNDLGWEIPDLSDAAVDISYIARTLLSLLFRDTDLKNLTPKHGPGAVAGGEKPWQKMHFKRLYYHLDECYPYTEFFFAHQCDLASSSHLYDDLEHHPSGMALGCFVPKDSRGPRFISMEPLELMWIQQGQKEILYDLLENHPLTRGHVNFRDQEINGDLALLGSTDENLRISTLDMKEASDRISTWLVGALLPPNILKPIFATRSEATELPDGRVQVLRKFAPMGSALCFPIESVIHWALAVSCLIYSGVEQPKALDAVYVYGDDIIIKGQDHQPLLRYFPEFKLMFNEGKCCTTGNFRESCGTDAFRGEQISPMRIKKPFPQTKTDGAAITAWVSYTNDAWARCYYHLSDAILHLIRPLTGSLPITGDENTPLALHVPHFPNCNIYTGKRRWNRDLQRYERKVLKTRTKRFNVPCDRSEYLRALISAKPTEVDHLNPCESSAGVYTIPRRVGVQLGWVMEPYGSTTAT